MKKYIRSSNEQSKSWKDIVKSLQSDWNKGRNPLYYSSDAGEYVESIAVDVEDSLGVELIPSIQAGRGEIGVYYGDNIGDLDYEDHCEATIEIAFESNSESDFREQYKAYMESTIERLLEYQADMGWLDDDYDEDDEW